MDTERKLILMYEFLHGRMEGGSCYLEVDEDEHGDPIGLRLMKDGNMCSRITKCDLLFEYMTHTW